MSFISFLLRSKILEVVSMLMERYSKEGEIDGGARREMIIRVKSLRRRDIETSGLR